MKHAEKGKKEFAADIGEYEVCWARKATPEEVKLFTESSQSSDAWRRQWPGDWPKN